VQARLIGASFTTDPSSPTECKQWWPRSGQAGSSRRWPETGSSDCQSATPVCGFGHRTGRRLATDVGLVGPFFRNFKLTNAVGVIDPMFDDSKPEQQALIDQAFADDDVAHISCVGNSLLVETEW